VADPRNSSAPFVPAADNLGASQFDDSIFENLVMPRSEPRADSDEDPDCDYEEEPPSQREGLPPGFRMRHDAHYVEELVSRNRASRLDEIEDVEGDAPPNGDRAPATPSLMSMPAACAEIGRSLDAIGACLRLFPDVPRSAVERVALDLIEGEVARATWLAQGLSLLDEEPPVANVPVDLPRLVGVVARRLAPGWERRGSKLVVESDEDALPARGDATLLGVAIAGMVMTLQAQTERVDGAAVRAHVRSESDRVLVEVAQDAVHIPVSWRARLLDVEWTDRPGGRRVALALAAARRVAELHLGTLSVADDEQRGCRLVLSLPRA
jgi:hypothetical protein